jgi:hypothetical protein
VSRPRKPFGANHPGRLPATMMKVLAAEMSDPSRLRRGKQYAKDGSVLDIVIDPGTVTCEIQGSRSTPYIAVVAVTPGNGMPLRRDVKFTCTCPDNDNWDDYACKHVVATMFVLSDEFLLEPELLDVWRGRASNDIADLGDHGDDDHEDGDEDGVEDDDVRPSGVGSGKTASFGVGSGKTGRHLRLVRPGEGASPTWENVRPAGDPLADLLRIPEGASLPEVTTIERIEPDLPRSRDLAAVLRDAVAHLRIDWD